MKKSNVILVIAAHPDDEVLGCGATMAKHVLNGDKVFIHIVSEGATSRDPERNVQIREDEIENLKQASKNAAEIIGTEPPSFSGFPDNRLDTIPLLDVIKSIEGIINSINPDIIYTHHYGDLNIDHRIVSNAVTTACRALPGKSLKKLCSFEILSSTEWSNPAEFASFIPNIFINIENTLKTKIEALNEYKQEMHKFPHPRSVEAVEYLAHYRGSSSGFVAAEAFMLIRELQS